jgi:alanine racemase
MTINRRRFIMLSGLSALAFPEIKVPSRNHQSGKIIPESWIELDPNHIKWNLSQIKKKVQVPVMGVVKADAYGHGLLEFGKALDKIGIHSLMVCKLEEAVNLRQNGITCPVFNFGPVIPENTPILVEYNISQFLHSGDIDKLSRQAEKLNTRINVHLHIDTGMNRMGFAHQNALPLIKKAASLKGLSITGLSTTLTEDPEFDKIQLQRLNALHKKAESLGMDLIRHAASSAGIFGPESFHLDMVRPGIALYGYYPNERTRKKDALSLRPVLSFKSRVIDIKTLNPGDTVSYLRKYKAQRKEKIAVIPVGYSDGYPLAGKAEVLIRGKRHPVLDTITANHMEARLGMDTDAAPGDEVTLIGTQGHEIITADDLADWAGVSNYKVLIGLGGGAQRVLKANP